jgi:iron complex transport system substrate-binding protein
MQYISKAFRLPALMFALMAAVLWVIQPFTVQAATKAPVNNTQVRTFKTELGTVKLKGIPKRIVTLSIAGTDAAIALGVKPVGVTISNAKQLPSYLKNQLRGVKVVGQLNAPSLETIAALKPDMIIIDHEYEFHKAIIPRLQKIAPVVGFRANSYQEAMTRLSQLGDMLGRKAQAKTFIAQFNKELQAAKAKIKDRNISVLGFFVNKSGINVWQDNSFSGTILTALKADYAFKGAGGKGDYTDFKTLSMEKILEIDPKLILVYKDMNQPKDGIAAVKGNPIWSKLKAVKNGDAVEVDRDLWSRSRGPIAAKLVVKQAASILQKF